MRKSESAEGGSNTKWAVETRSDSLLYKAASISGEDDKIINENSLKDA